MAREDAGLEIQVAPNLENHSGDGFQINDVFDWVKEHKVESALIAATVATAAVGGMRLLKGPGLTSAEESLVSRGFQLPSEVKNLHGGFPGPTFRNFLAADTVEQSARSGVRSAASFGYPEDSWVTLHGGRKASRTVLHLGDGTLVESTPSGIWEGKLPNGSSLLRSGHSMTFALPGESTWRGANLTLDRGVPMLNGEVASGQVRSSIDTLLGLNHQYPKIVPHSITALTL